MLGKDQTVELEYLNEYFMGNQKLSFRRSHHLVEQYECMLRMRSVAYLSFWLLDLSRSSCLKICECNCFEVFHNSFRQRRDHGEKRALGGAV